MGSLPQSQSGKLRALAVSGNKRLATALDVPTVSEAGVKNYEMSYWTAAYLPAGAPAAVVERLRTALAKAAQSPEVKAFVDKISGEMVLAGPQGLTSFQAAEAKKWERVIKTAGIEPQ